MKTSELKEIVRQVLAEDSLDLAEHEPRIITDMQKIVDKKQAQKVMDPATGKQVMVDQFTASAVVLVWKKLNDAMKRKLVELPLVKLIPIVWKLITR